jgi:hypothetical protein
MRVAIISLFVVCLIAISCGPRREKHPAPRTNFRDASLALTARTAPAPANAAADDSRPPWQLRSGNSILCASIDPLAMPWHASVQRFEIATSRVSTLLSGESGDPLLLNSSDEVLFFNRSFDSQNFRRLQPRGDSLLVSSQQRFAAGEIGDPHDALYLGNDRVLLAHYTQGRLVVMQQSSGAEIETIAADWDLPVGVKLKPESLIPIEKDGRRFVYVLHQALALEGGSMYANNSQRIFVLEDRDGDLVPLNLDSHSEKIAGIPLSGSFPRVVRFARRDKILLVSMCSRFVSTASSDHAQACRSVIEELDPATNSVRLLWNLTDSGIFMNGAVVPGPDAATFFASVEHKMGDDIYAQQVLRFNLAARTFSPTYTFAPNSGGFWATLYDEEKKILYVGDTGSSSLGTLVSIPEGMPPTKMDFPAVPYSCVFSL